MLGRILAGIAYAVWRAWQSASAAPHERDIEWDDARRSRSRRCRGRHRCRRGSSRTAVDAEADGTCPATHPVKGKLTSGIYHVAGGANYDRTKPDRCYVDEDAAKRDGLRRAKA